MAVDCIDMVNDPRVEHKTANLNGHTYHYLLGVPKTPIKGTVFLIHGWPDCCAGWRYQIPMLLELGFRVVVPDLMGFAGSEAPRVPPGSIQLYSHKRAADDFAELARQLGAARIVLGGHDWGGSVEAPIGVSRLLRMHAVRAAAEAVRVDGGSGQGPAAAVWVSAASRWARG